MTAMIVALASIVILPFLGIVVTRSTSGAYAGIILAILLVADTATGAIGILASLGL